MSLTAERVPTMTDETDFVEEGIMAELSYRSAVASVTLVESMPGFDSDTAFTLDAIDEAGVLQSLRSTRDPELRFVISPAEVFFADYKESLQTVVTAPVADALGTTTAEAVLRLYVLLTVGESLADTTANLRAPLVVDQRTGKGVQVILDDDSLPLAQPLPTD